MTLCENQTEVSLEKILLPCRIIEGELSGGELKGGVIDWCILIDLEIQTKFTVIDFIVLKSRLKSCVIDLMIHKF